MRSRFLTLSLTLCTGLVAAASPAFGAAGPWYENPHSQVRLVSPYSVAARSGPFQLGVQFKLAPGWHAYWRNSGDAGFPPSFDFRQTPQLVSPTLAWPAPHRYEMPGDLVAFGYADEVVYPVAATLDATGDLLAIRVAADYLVCAVECVPYRYDLHLDQPLADTATADPETGPLLAAWQARVPAPAAVDGAGAFEANLRRAGDAFELEVAFAGPATDLIPDLHPHFEIGRPLATTANGTTVFKLPVTRKDKTAALPKATAFAWVVTGPAAPVEGHAEVPLPRRRKLAVPSATTAIGVVLIALIARRRRRARAAAPHRAPAREKSDNAQREGGHRS